MLSRISVPDPLVQNQLNGKARNSVLFTTRKHNPVCSPRPHRYIPQDLLPDTPEDIVLPLEASGISLKVSRDQKAKEVPFGILFL